MYCYNCMGTIKKDDLVYCEQCGSPLHKQCANHCLSCGKTLCDTCFAENNFKCESCYKPDNAFSVIRRSHLEQYAGCPYSVYLQLILGIEPPMGSAAQLGVIVHELIEESSSGLIEYSAMDSELDKRVEEWNKENKIEYSTILPEQIEVGHICLENYMKIKNSFPKNFDSEYNIKFSIRDDLPQISCTLDRIVQRNGQLEIHDWKTGRKLSGQKLVTDLQPPLYMYAVYKEFGSMPASFTLHYLRDGKDIVYNKVDDNTYTVKTRNKEYTLDVKDALARTEKILEGIQGNHFNMPDEKTHQWRCKSLCWFGISGKCAGSFNQQWRELGGRP